MHHVTLHACVHAHAHTHASEICSLELLHLMFLKERPKGQGKRKGFPIYAHAILWFVRVPVATLTAEDGCKVLLVPIQSWTRKTWLTVLLPSGRTATN